MSTVWQYKKERSTVFIMKFIRNSALFFGRPFVRTWLYPISLYYFLFTPKTKKQLANYFQQVLSRRPKWKDFLKLYFNFANVTLDRIYYLTNKLNYFSIKLHGVSAININKKQGMVLLGSHLGSFEAMKTLAQQNNMPLKVLMHIEHSQQMIKLLHEINPGAEQLIINMVDMDALLQVKEWVGQGGVVGILADRVYHEDKVVSFDFLGRAADFALGPFRLIKLLNVPVMFCCGIYSGGNKYDIFFEKLSSVKQLSAHELLKEYVMILENYVRKYPYNWFNFYDYWQKN